MLCQTHNVCSLLLVLKQTSFFETFTKPLSFINCVESRTRVFAVDPTQFFFITRCRYFILLFLEPIPTGALAVLEDWQKKIRRIASQAPSTVHQLSLRVLRCHSRCTITPRSIYSNSSLYYFSEPPYDKHPNKHKTSNARRTEWLP